MRTAYKDFLIRNWQERDGTPASEVIAVEIRKMYLLPSARGLGLGKYLLQQLEKAIASRGFQQQV
jgi:GNAT superfamily N-acetyltransferase